MKQGESLEQYILNLCRLDGYHLIRKTDPAVRIIRWLRNDQFTGCFLHEGMRDLTGPAKGFHVEIEVKDCKGMRFPLSKLRPHQYKRMVELYEDNSLSGLALRLRGETANDDKVMFIPAREVISHKESGKKSIRWVEMEPLVEQGLVILHQYRSKGDIEKLFRLAIDTAPGL